jgi:hypothetical protein
MRIEYVDGRACPVIRCAECGNRIMTPDGHSVLVGLELEDDRPGEFRGLSRGLPRHRYGRESTRCRPRSYPEAMAVKTCDQCADGWVCELHSEEPWTHHVNLAEACGVAMPCPIPRTAWAEPRRQVGQAARAPSIESSRSSNAVQVIGLEKTASAPAWCARLTYGPS